MQTLSDQAIVAKTKRGEPIAHHDPVHPGAVDRAPVAAALVHHLGVVAFAGHRQGCRIDSAEHVEVEKVSLSGVSASAIAWASRIG